MSALERTKLNLLLQRLGDADVVSARWLRAQGYSTSLVARYLRSGWLRQPVRGAYCLPRAQPSWDAVVRALQQRESLRLHVGGRFALVWLGHEHSLRLGTATTVTLYGAARLPAWAAALPLASPLQAMGRGPFAPSALSFTDTTDVDALYAEGLERRFESSLVGEVVMSSPERAMLELCSEVHQAAEVHEVDALMQGLATLRPALLGKLLRDCDSIKAKRLFLAIAERQGHAWLPQLELRGVELGSGKRAFIKGGRLDPKYQITLPADLGELHG